MYLKITDLNNPPPGVSVTLKYNTTRNGNTIHSASTWFTADIGFFQDGSLGRFNNGDIVEVCVKLTELSGDTFMRLYARAQWGTSPGAGGTTGYLNWVYVPPGGRWYDSGAIGSDCNKGYGLTRAMVGQTVVFKMVFANMTPGNGATGFQLHFGTVGYSGAMVNSTATIELMYAYANYTPPTDPFELLDVPVATTGGGPDSPSSPVGYDGIVNDDIDFPSNPVASAANANFISIWTPTLDQVQDLAKWMWTTDPLKWEFWQKLLQNPLELIFSLTIMPIPIHHTDDPSPATTDQLVALNDSLSLGWQDTGIGMDWITEQYVEIDMGSIDIEEVWGAFLDYEPYTKIDIFLPYIGMKTLDTNDCMPRTIALKYKIDLATGTCLALIKCDNSIYYHFSGNCASQIPITVNQCQEIVRGLMTMAVGATTVALGGAMTAGEHASKAAITQGTAMKAGGSAMVGSGANSAAKGVNVSRSGTIGCAAGLMDVQTPYLVISRPRQALPERQNTYTGYPSFITEQIGDLEGYTEVQIIHLENMTCTDEEYQEIDSLLLGGVII